jgi:predicted nucleic acid-binding protein
MAGRVVDASAVAAVVFVEPDADRVAAEIEGDDLFAPTLLPYELASVARKKIAAHPELTDRILLGLGAVGDLAITLLDVDPVAAVQVARAAKSSTYDASYLVLARDLSLALTTLDVKLRRLARREERRRTPATGP